MKFLINTILDGFDVEVINLWDHPTRRTRIVAKCSANEAVDMLGAFPSPKSLKFVKLRTSAGLEGWCSQACIKPYNEAIVQPSYADTVERILPDIKPGLIQRLFSGKFNRRR